MSSPTERPARCASTSAKYAVEEVAMLSSSGLPSVGTPTCVIVRQYAQHSRCVFVVPDSIHGRLLHVQAVAARLGTHRYRVGAEDGL